ncbi:MAG TPA: hypothetical protein PK967_15235 [Candidatus Hydrogenedentes bacterium]|nr:hypothetical protein [Candidatus Hydrogenedentota bacterium]
MDIVPFGEMLQEKEGCTIIWEDPRELHRVVVEFEAPPDADLLALHYWQSSWPHREIPRNAPSGAGQSGWFDVGDWYKGQWRTADANVTIEETRATFTFNPVNRLEFPELKTCDAPYRTTLKLRIPRQNGLPGIVKIEAYTDTIWRPLEFVVETSDGRPLIGHFEIFNGGMTMFDGHRGCLQYAETQHHGSFDETIATWRNDKDTFSFAPNDLVKWGHIFLPDFGVLVRRADVDITYEKAARDCMNAGKDIYSRVFDMPEQTFPNAWGDMPEKGRHYIPLSFEGTRQHFGLDGACNVFRNRNWIRRLAGRDTDRCDWRGDEIWCEFGLPPEAMKDRTLVDGCLPMTITSWELNGVRYTQTAFAAPIAGIPGDGERVLADDPIALYVRFAMEPVANVPARARLRIASSDGGGTESLELDGPAIVAGKQLRILVSNTKGLSGNGHVVHYEANIAPGGPSRVLDMAIPFVTLRKNDPETDRLLPVRFDTMFDATRSYWRKRIEAGARIRTPEPMINEFYDAHLPHLLINTEREVTGSLRYMAKVGTFSYGVYANEACMMITDLDRRGFHQRAEEAIETWLHYQGKRPLPGDYLDAEGVFYSAGGYEDDNGYNQHHGWVLWCIGEHYWYTRDAAWIERTKPNILKACDWITRERARTIEWAARRPLRAIERGLLPPGSLEDIADWRCWLSNNVYAWWGMDNAARALKAAGYAEGESLLGEAEKYRKDILAAFTEAMRRSPVVRLRNGRWIPQIPSEAHRRGRSFGWITQTLEGSIHLVRCGLIEPKERMSDWIIQDYEDNLYLSEQFGYSLTGDDFDRHWFNRGGISQQANLLCNPIPYLLRDEIPHFLRAYFNAFAVSYFPDTRMMTEHALPNMGDFRGDHYKTSDEANSTYWLRMMFIHERGDDLWIGAAIPRYWLADGQRIGIENAATHFGPMSATIESQAAAGRITLCLDPPRRNPPKRIIARFRHPEGKRMTRCEVNGTPCADIVPDKEYVALEMRPEVMTIVAHY